MIKLSIIFILILIYNTVSGQIDSLNYNKIHNNMDILNSFKEHLTLISRLDKQDNQLQLIEQYKETGDICFDWHIYEKANIYYVKSYTIYNRIHLHNSSIYQQLLNSIALTYNLIQNSDSELFYYNQLLKYEDQTDAKQDKILCLSKMTSIYMNDKKYEKALECNHSILKLNTELKDEKNVAVSLNNIGFNYTYLEDIPNAKLNFEKALSLFKLLKLEKSHDYQTALINLGIICQNQKDYTKAHSYLTELETILVKANQKDRLAELYNIIGNVYFLENEKNAAIEYISKSEQLAKQTHSLSVLLNNYLVFSRLYQSLNDFELALKYYKDYKSINDSLTNSIFSEKLDILKRINQTTNIENQLKLLLIEKDIAALDVKNVKLESEKREQAYQIQLKTQEVEKQKEVQKLLLLQETFEIEGKQKEILLLNQKNQYQILALNEKNLEQKDRKRSIEILQKSATVLKQDKKIALQNVQKQRLYTILTSSGLSFILFITFLIFRSQRKQRKLNILLEEQKDAIEERNEELKQLNEEISTQKDEIEKQRDEINKAKNKIEKENKNLTDSIQYALRIQQALLPSTKILSALSNEHFVLYKPRDIVSGDFYWFKQIGNFIIVAAADCTGHGVPGAFMSVLGISRLNDLVNKRGLDAANEILNELRHSVKKTLQQEGQKGQTQDGMDIAFCIIDIEGKVLQFSGAFNPLYLIRKNDKGDYELLETKADRMPVGIHPKDEQSFTNNVIKLLNNDTFYIFSDGYISQFGGDKNDKFKSKRFQEILLKIQYESLDIQKQILNETIVNWQGDNEQTDDILVIGVKIKI